MAEVSTGISYTVRFTENEYKLMTKALALLAGVEGPRATPEDKAAAQQLNLKLLDQQAQDLREKLNATEHKRQAQPKP